MSTNRFSYSRTQKKDWKLRYATISDLPSLIDLYRRAGPQPDPLFGLSRMSEDLWQKMLTDPHNSARYIIAEIENFVVLPETASRLFQGRNSAYLFHKIMLIANQKIAGRHAFQQLIRGLVGCRKHLPIYKALTEKVKEEGTTIIASCYCSFGTDDEKEIKILSWNIDPLYNGCRIEDVFLQFILFDGSKRGQKVLRILEFDVRSDEFMKAAIRAGFSIEAGTAEGGVFLRM